jgi:hypothetical protein
VLVGPLGSKTAWAKARATVPSGGGHRFSLPVRRAPFQVRLFVTPTFSPSQYGSGDTRQLGVRAAFSVR